MTQTPSTRTPTMKGLVGVGMFISFAAREGWSLCEPLEHDLAFDFLAEIDGEWKKIQVKTAYTSSRGYREVNFRRGRVTKRTKYRKNDFDFLFIYDPKTKKTWFIPMLMLSDAKSCVIASAKRWEPYRVF